MVGVFSLKYKVIKVFSTGCKMFVETVSDFSFNLNLSNQEKNCLML